MKTNASRHKAMSHGKFLEKEKHLDEEPRQSLGACFRKVVEADAEGVRKHGNPNRSAPSPG